MSRKEIYEQKAGELLLPIVESHGFELVDVEYVKEAGNWYLRRTSIRRAALRWMTVRWSAGPSAISWMKMTSLKIPIFWRSAHRALAVR